MYVVVVTPSDLFEVREPGYLERRTASHPAIKSQWQSAHKNGGCGDNPDSAGI
jgi:hypothetical protein